MKTWTVRISIHENGSMVNAEARLEGRAGEPLVGEGAARCNPDDENVPAIGDELSSARALSALCHQLLHSAAMDIEAHTHKPVDRLRA